MITTEIVAIILAVGGLLPLLTAVVQQPRWSNRVRTIMSVVVSTVAGIVTYVTQFGLEITSTSSLVTIVVGVILASAASYNSIWKPSGTAPVIEAKTSATPRRALEEDVVEAAH